MFSKTRFRLQQNRNQSSLIWNGSCTPAFFGCIGASLEVEIPMKIYLLMLLIGILLTAIHFTAPADSKRKIAQQ
jgi:hypothetical protein